MIFAILLFCKGRQVKEASLDFPKLHHLSSLTGYKERYNNASWSSRSSKLQQNPWLWCMLPHSKRIPLPRTPRTNWNPNLSFCCQSTFFLLIKPVCQMFFELVYSKFCLIFEYNVFLFIHVPWHFLLDGLDLLFGFASRKESFWAMLHHW